MRRFRVVSQPQATTSGFEIVGPVAATILLAAALLLTFAPQQVALASEGCANEARRLEQGSVVLPDCRAYEMVTPPDKGSGGPEPVGQDEYFEGRELEPLDPAFLNGTPGVRASLSGGRLAWASEPMPTADAFGSYGLSQLSTRGPSGWESEELVPPLSVSNDLTCPFTLGVSAWSPDLSEAIFDLPAGPPAANAASPAGFHEEHECGHDEPRLVPGEPEHFRNLFLHDATDGRNRLINLTPGGVLWPEPASLNQQYWPASFLVGSDDLSHVVFEEELPLTHAAEEITPKVKDACENGNPACWQGQDNLYEWSGGNVRLVTVLDGENGVETPVHGSLAGATRNYWRVHQIPGTPSEDYRNIAQFKHAISTDGSRIFFEAPGDGSEGDLYVREDGERTVQVDLEEAGAPGPSGGGDFQWASADGSRVFFTDDGRLTSNAAAEVGKPDLYEYDIPSGSLRDLTASSGPAGVLGVAGASQDGARVYFVAEAELTGQRNSQGESAVAGLPNLYVWHSDAISFIATLDPESDECDWTTVAACNGGAAFETGLTSRTSEDGAYLAFDSVRRLTDYENKSPETGKPLIEIYLYDVATGRLVCASCNPTGAPMMYGAAIKPPVSAGMSNSITVYWHNSYPQRNLSDRGQVFFETADALLPRDVNGRRDVYEYAGGRLNLLSTGDGESGSFFLDASPDGNDVFFSTAQQLLPRDVDSLYDYYDARVDGGFPQPAPSSPPCEGEACKGSMGASPTAAVPGTAALTGTGNVRSRDRCSSIGRRARGLSDRSKRLRRDARRARRVGEYRHAKRRSQQAARLTRRAKKQTGVAKRCRHVGTSKSTDRRRRAIRQQRAGRHVTHHRQDRTKPKGSR